MGGSLQNPEGTSPPICEELKPRLVYEDYFGGNAQDKEENQ